MPARLAIAASALLFCFAITAAQAKTFKLGDDKPVASIDIPESWEPREIDDGVEGTSKDKETYVAAEVVEAANLEEAGTEEAKFFKKQKIKIKTDTAKHRDIKIGELQGVDFTWEATDEDGPTHVSMTILGITEKTFLMLTYWGSADGEKSNGKDLQAIADSIKAVK